MDPSMKYFLLSTKSSTRQLAIGLALVTLPLTLPQLAWGRKRTVKIYNCTGRTISIYRAADGGMLRSFKQSINANTTSAEPRFKTFIYQGTVVCSVVSRFSDKTKLGKKKRVSITQASNKGGICVESHEKPKKVLGVIKVKKVTPEITSYCSSCDDKEKTLITD